MREYISFLKEVTPAFIQFMTASQRWNNYYANSLHRFDNYLVTNHSNSSELTQEMVDNWCRQRATESNNTCLTRTAVIVALIRYMQKRGMTNVKEPDRSKAQKCTHIPHAFTKNELTRFFYACDHIKPPENRKVSKVFLINRLILCTIFRLMFSSGLRPNEARQLRRSDVDLEHGVLNVVITKGYNQHYVALHERMIDIMREYDRRMNELVPERIYFFPKGASDFRSNAWLCMHFRKIWEEANPLEHAVSYDFRHNYAIENINSWRDGSFVAYRKLYCLSKSMGHCNVEHTKYYYSIVPRMAEILEEKSAAGFDELVPEINEDEYW